MIHMIYIFMQKRPKFFIILWYLRRKWESRVMNTINHTFRQKLLKKTQDIYLAITRKENYQNKMKIDQA